MMIKVYKVTHKSSDLTSVLGKHFEKSLNSTGIKFISLFIGTIFKVLPVCFKKFFSGFKNNCNSDSFSSRFVNLHTVDSSVNEV